MVCWFHPYGLRQGSVGRALSGNVARGSRRGHLDAITEDAVAGHTHVIGSVMPPLLQRSQHLMPPVALVASSETHQLAGKLLA